VTARSDAGFRWGDLAVRVASAGVLAPLGLAAIWLGGPVWGAALAIIAAGLGLEWAGLCSIDMRSPRGFGVAAALILAGGAAEYLSALAGLFVVGVGSVLASLIARRGSAGVGVIYIGAGYLSLILLRRSESGLADVLFVVLVVWGCDIGAYLFGRLIGGPRLAPRLSPGKTWAGAAGGLLCGTLTGLSVAWRFGTWGDGLVATLFIAAGLSLIAQAGDLLESAIKRHFGKKDSGSLIPGHGGLLDRLDGLIAAAPAAYLLSLAATPGKPVWEWGLH
jgi:phosphatidate cytidylyltransferase